MGLNVVTVASGGLAVAESTAGGTPVSESASGRGIPVTKVTGGKPGMPVVYETIGIAAPFVPTTFNPADQSNITLSGGNLTATGTGAGVGAVRSVGSFNSGKWYFEYKIITIFTNSMGFGVCTSAAVLSSVNTTGLAAVIFQRLGSVLINGVSAGLAFGARAVNDVIGVAVDFNSKLAWFRIAPAGLWNLSAPADPTAGIGGLNISALSGPQFGLFTIGNTSDKVTANFGASAFIGAIPSGFTGGLPG